MIDDRRMEYGHIQGFHGLECLIAVSGAEDGLEVDYSLHSS